MQKNMKILTSVIVCSLMLSTFYIARGGGGGGHGGGHGGGSYHGGGHSGGRGGSGDHGGRSHGGRNDHGGGHNGHWNHHEGHGGHGWQGNHWHGPYYYGGWWWGPTGLFLVGLTFYTCTVPAIQNTNTWIIYSDDADTYQSWPQDSDNLSIMQVEDDPDGYNYRICNDGNSCVKAKPALND